MNSNDLHDLFDEAAGTFSPQPDVGHLTTLLERSGRGRPALFGIGAVAAALLFTVGGVAALSGRSGDEPASPGELVELPTTATAPATTDGSRSTTTTVGPVVTVAPRGAADAPVAAPTFADPIFAAPPTSTSVVATIAPTTSIPAVTLPPTTHATPAPTSTVAPSQPASPPPQPTHAPAPPPPPPTTQAPATTHAPTTTHAPSTTHAPTTTTGGQVAFTAHQTWGSCGSEPPYEELGGTAAAGSTIDVSSPYGSASTTAGADGSWYVQVFFAGAPVDDGFTIAVSSAQGSATFPFVVTG